MSTTYGKASWPVPSLTDTPNFPVQMQAVATQIDNFTVPKYASGTAVTTANPSPADGDRWYRTDLHMGWVTHTGPGQVPDGDSFGLIGKQVLGAGVASLAFTGIPSIYRHLRLCVSAQDLESPLTTDNLFVTFNGDTGANYGYHEMHLSGSATVVKNGFTSTPDAQIGFPWATAGGTTGLGHIVVDIPDYKNTTWYKGYTSRSGAGNGSNVPVFAVLAGVWRSTAAISTINIFSTVSGTLQTNSCFTLYGVGN